MSSSADGSARRGERALGFPGLSVSELDSPVARVCLPRTTPRLCPRADSFDSWRATQLHPRAPALRRPGRLVRQKAGAGRLLVETEIGTTEAVNVVIATAPFTGQPSTYSAAIPSEVLQLHSKHYRNRGTDAAGLGCWSWDVGHPGARSPKNSTRVDGGYTSRSGATVGTPPLSPAGHLLVARCHGDLDRPLDLYPEVKTGVYPWSPVWMAVAISIFAGSRPME